MEDKAGSVIDKFFQENDLLSKCRIIVPDEKNIIMVCIF